MAARLDEDVVAKRDLGRLSAGVAAYFDGDLHAIDDLPVVAARRRLPAGRVEGDARGPRRRDDHLRRAGRAAGSPKAVRAAASACARNLIAPIVPCHRIVRTGGALGGYYYGVDTKTGCSTTNAPVSRARLDCERG